MLLFFINGLLQLHIFAWSPHLLAGGLTFLGGFCLYSAGIMGAGDVKLITVVSLWLGISLLPCFLVVMALAGLGTAIALLLIRGLSLERLLPERTRLPAAFTVHSRVPYGVAIAFASIFVSARLPDKTWLF